VAKAVSRIVAVLLLIDLFQVLGFQADVVAIPAEAVVDVLTHVEHEKAMGVDLLDSVKPPKAELENATTLGGQLRNPGGHFDEPDLAAGLNHR
ncbi:MAG TPA: hypothetical protein VK961_23505, partial [Chthoniobacter sp.]|nr:hypothetical protein [Chthoniobacter sp.]